jgi:hypothetical protein
MDNQPETLDCGHTASPVTMGGTGYGEAPDGKRYCYTCCGARDYADMIAEGKAVLYLQGNAADGYALVNWPNTLRFPVKSYSSHPRGGGMGAQRTDAWFNGPDGHVWHAINRGDMQLARCRRTRRRWRTDEAQPQSP